MEGTEGPDDEAGTGTERDRGIHGGGRGTLGANERGREGFVG
jgi:hypothetical protein